jgi:hypothetical protein
MGTTGFMAIQSGAVRDAGQCRIEVRPYLPDQLQLCVNTPRYQIEISLAGSHLVHLRRDIDAAIEQAEAELAQRLKIGSVA